MKKSFRFKSLLPGYILVLSCLLAAAIGTSKVVTVVSQNAPIINRTCVIIDAGHGGIDGGATSCTGVLESSINLEIALKLEDLIHLLGYDTIMIRRTDCSVYTQGETIAAKKLSDLKERVRIVNQAENAILLSIHQNQFTDSRYSGAQVFFAPTKDSELLAKQMQASFVQTLNPGSKRQVKKASGIYLMEHIQCTGVLIECGFLSNPVEEANLRKGEYQNNICCVLASVCSQYLHTITANT